MTRTISALGLAAIVLIWMGPWWTLGVQAQAPVESPKIIALLPENFRGWACIDFGVAGAPPLPREGDAFIARPRQGEAIRTSYQPGAFSRFYDAMVEINGQRRPLPQDIYARMETPVGDSKQPGQRYCAFYGTEDEADAAPETSGSQPSSHEESGVSEQERQALVALYKATGGDRWNHRAGWLGSPGTECKWHGLTCWSEYGKQNNVTELDLYENNLVGTIPQEAGQLTHLEELMIFGNHLSGMLPQELIQRWKAGALEIRAEAPLLTDVSKIENEVDPSALLCGRRRITFGSDGRAVLFTVRCRNATPDDRTTFCEVKEGKVWPGTFAELGRLIEQNGFYGLHAKYSRNITDSGFDRIRVTKSGKHFEVEDYAGGGPFDLWVIETAIKGVASEIEWEKTTTQPTCSEWDEALAAHESETKK